MADEQNNVETAGKRKGGRKRLYAEGQEPWTLEGVSRSTWDRKQKAKSEAAEPIGDHGGVRDQASHAKLEASPADVPPAAPERQEPPAASTSAIEELPATVTAAPIEAPVQAPVQSNSANVPVTVVAVPAKPSPNSAAPTATVFVSLRSPVTQHERMREMAHRTRRSLQDLVSTAVDEYLTRNGY